MCFTIILSKTFHVIVFIIFGRVSLCFRWNFIFYHFIKDLNHVIRVPLHHILDILRYTHWKAVAILHTQKSCSQSGGRSLSRFLIRQQLCVNIAYANSMKYSIYILYIVYHILFRSWMFHLWASTRTIAVWETLQVPIFRLSQSDKNNEIAVILELGLLRRRTKCWQLSWILPEQLDGRQQ